MTEQTDVAKRIFVSHAVADLALASGLTQLIEGAYSKVVETFQSSDGRPTKGISPGDAWMERITKELQIASAVWVLATPHSVARPWIYWEAGIGSAIAPGRVVVVCVGIDAADLPTPLNQYQAYGAKSDPIPKMEELIVKTASQFGMSLRPALVKDVIEEWRGVIDSYQPAEPTDPGQTVEITPEQVSDFASLLTEMGRQVSELVNERKFDRTRERTQRRRDAAAGLLPSENRNYVVHTAPPWVDEEAGVWHADERLRRRIDREVPHSDP